MLLIFFPLPIIIPSIVISCLSQVFLPKTNGAFETVVPPVVTQTIYDRKANPDLVIVRMDRNSGPATGCQENQNVFLLCEKVQRDNIEIVFTEYDEK